MADKPKTVEGHDIHEIASVVSSHEAQIQNLGGQIASLATTVREQGETTGQAIRDLTGVIRQETQALHSRITGMSTTNWPVIFQFALILIGLGGGAVTFFYRENGRLEATALKLEARDYEQNYDRGRKDQQIDDLRAGLAKLDIDHQREMRDLDSGLEGRILAQRERIDTLTDVLVKMRDELLPSDARNDERLKALEREQNPSSERMGSK